MIRYILFSLYNHKYFVPTSLFFLLISSQFSILTNLLHIYYTLSVSNKIIIIIETEIGKLSKFLPVQKISKIRHAVGTLGITSRDRLKNRADFPALLSPNSGQTVTLSPQGRIIMRVSAVNRRFHHDNPLKVRCTVSGVRVRGNA